MLPNILLRCNRFHKCGYDPVPLTKEEKLNLEKENTADKNIE